MQQFQYFFMSQHHVCTCIFQYLFFFATAQHFFKKVYQSLLLDVGRNPCFSGPIYLIRRNTCKTLEEVYTALWEKQLREGLFPAENWFYAYMSIFFYRAISFCCSSPHPTLFFPWAVMGVQPNIHAFGIPQGKQLLRRKDVAVKKIMGGLFYAHVLLFLC